MQDAASEMPTMPQPASEFIGPPAPAVTAPSITPTTATTDPMVGPIQPPPAIPMSAKEKAKGSYDKLLDDYDSQIEMVKQSEYHQLISPVEAQKQIQGVLDKKHEAAATLFKDESARLDREQKLKDKISEDLLNAKKVGLKIYDKNGQLVSNLSVKDAYANPEDYSYGERPVQPATFLRLGQQKDQWTEMQWSKLVDKVNALTAGSRKVVGIAGTANMRADRALEILNNPLTPQELKLINIDIAGIMKGGVPDMEEVRSTEFKNLQTRFARLVQEFGGANQADIPKVVQKYKEILQGLKKIDQRVIEKNLGISAIGAKKIIAEDPQRWKDLQEQVISSTDMMNFMKNEIPGYVEYGKETVSGTNTVHAAAHPKAFQAERWAKARPNNPRAKEILKRLGE
jgi:hypothetical protein